MESIVSGAILPHPPILVPEIGRERLKEAEKSKYGMEETARRIKELAPDVIVVVTPHGAVGQASIPVYTGHVFEGNFSEIEEVKSPTRILDCPNNLKKFSKCWRARISVGAM